MIRLPHIHPHFTYIILRVITGVIFITHGAARIYYGTIDGFGEFKDRLCTIFHSILIITGISLIHLHRGWFTIGQNTDGAEYSLLLMPDLILIYSKSPVNQP
jgi:putative oxidoreductase